MPVQSSGYLSEKFKLFRCSSRYFQVDCFSTLLTICAWNWNKICILVVYLCYSFNCIMPFPPKMYQLRNSFHKVISLSCFQYIDQGRRSCPGASCAKYMALIAKTIVAMLVHFSKPIEQSLFFYLAGFHNCIVFWWRWCTMAVTSGLFYSEFKDEF